MLPLAEMVLLQMFSFLFRFFLKVIWVKKVSSGWVKKYPWQRWVGTLFSARLKYERVRLGQAPSITKTNSG